MVFEHKSIQQKDIEQIVKKHKEFKTFWGRLREIHIDDSWSCPEDVVNLLDDIWFEVQISLSYKLREFFREHPEEENLAKLISLWVILGSLVENTLRFFLSIYMLETKESEYKKYLYKNGTISTVRFADLICFFKKEEILDSNLLEWLSEIRKLRNSVHSFNRRELYNSTKLEEYIVQYKDFLEEIDERLPWP